jgi:hypothetical protein
VRATLWVGRVGNCGSGGPREIRLAGRGRSLSPCTGRAGECACARATPCRWRPGPALITTRGPLWVGGWVGGTRWAGGGGRGPQNYSPQTYVRFALFALLRVYGTSWPINFADSVRGGYYRGCRERVRETFRGIRPVKRGRLVRFAD